MQSETPVALTALTERKKNGHLSAETCAQAKLTGLGDRAQSQLSNCQIYFSSGNPGVESSVEAPGNIIFDPFLSLSAASIGLVVGSRMALHPEHLLGSSLLLQQEVQTAEKTV